MLGKCSWGPGTRQMQLKLMCQMKICSLQYDEKYLTEYEKYRYRVV